MNWVLVKLVMCLSWSQASCSATPLRYEVVTTYASRAECLIAAERYNRGPDYRARYTCAERG